MVRPQPRTFASVPIFLLFSIAILLVGCRKESEEFPTDKEEVVSALSGTKWICKGADYDFNPDSPSIYKYNRYIKFYSNKYGYYYQYDREYDVDGEYKFVDVVHFKYEIKGSTIRIEYLTGKEIYNTHSFTINKGKIYIGNDEYTRAEDTSEYGDFYFNFGDVLMLYDNDDGVWFYGNGEIPERATSKLNKHFSYAYIGSGITRIGDYAFQSTDLNYIDWSEAKSLKSIGKHAFEDCSIESLYIPDGVTEIGEYAFYGCYALERLSLPKNLKTIEEGVFAGCKMLNRHTITLPDHLETLEDYAFDGTNTKLYNASSLKYIGKLAVNTCEVYSGKNSKDKTFESLEYIGHGNSLSLETLPKSIKQVEGLGILCNDKFVINIPFKCDGGGAIYSRYSRGDLYVNLRTPLDFEAFLSDYKYGWTLHVPVGCKSVYANHSAWRGFKAIVEDSSLVPSDGGGNSGNGGDNGAQDESFITIKDANFKNYLLANFDTNKDGKISTSEALAVTNIYCNQLGITSLDGIEYFTNLNLLQCYDNNLTSLDVSKCTALEHLWCYNNNLTSLNVSKCTNLEDLICRNNNLTSLDVNKCAALIYLYCNDNYLTSLDVINCTKLINLHCDYNNLISLDVSKCVKLKELTCLENPLKTLILPANISIDKLYYPADISPQYK